MADVLYGLTDLSDPKSFVPLLVSPAGKVLIAGMPTQLGSATAANSMPVVLATDQEGVSPLGTHTTNANLSGVVALTPPTGSKRILLQAFTQNIRYTIDGSVPSATNGFQLTPGGDPLVIVFAANVVLKAIEESAGASIQYVWGV